MASIIQMRRDTAANWTSNDPTLAAGEIGFETDTKKFKFGDGITAWTSLGYYRYTYATFIDNTDSPYEVEVGADLHVDTSAASVTIKLPASPAAGAAPIAIRDAAGSFGTNNVTIDRNGNTIEGDAADDTLRIPNSTTFYFYNGSTWKRLKLFGAEGIYANTGTTLNVEENDTIQLVALSAARDFSSGDELNNGESLTLRITGGDTYAITWPTMEWIGGSAPTLEGGNEWVILWKENNTLYGLYVGISS